jgi:hypothetical protein
MRLLEIYPCLGLASATDTNFTFGNILVILLSAVCAVAFVAAGFDAAFIKDNITAASAVDTSLPEPIVSSAEIFQQIA